MLPIFAKILVFHFGVIQRLFFSILWCQLIEDFPFIYCLLNSSPVITLILDCSEYGQFSIGLSYFPLQICTSTYRMLPFVL